MPASQRAVTFVRSMNEHRRHLTPGQNAVIVASMQDWENANVKGQNNVMVNVDHDEPRTRVEDRAALSGAGRTTQKVADKLAKADPELARKVAHGEISLPKALKQQIG